MDIELAPYRPETAAKQNVYSLVLPDRFGYNHDKIQHESNSLHREIATMSLRALHAINRPSQKSVQFGQKILPILKLSVQNPDRAYFFLHDKITNACCHNGYILYQKKAIAPNYAQSHQPGNYLIEKYVCRKIIDDPEKFDRNHCSFEIEVLRITDDEGKVQVQKNYHAAHKDDYNFYNQVVFMAKKDAKNYLPLSENVHGNELVTYTQENKRQEIDIYREGGLSYDDQETNFKKMIRAQKYLEMERSRTMMRLNLENQLRKIITNEMEIKVIKICREEMVADDIDELLKNSRRKNPVNPEESKDKNSSSKSNRKTGFNKEGNFIRNAYLIYLHQMLKDKERIDITNLKLYIEGTFNSMSEISYEVFLLRSFIPEATMMLTFGMLLIPKEQVYGNDEEIQMYTLDLCFRSVIKIFKIYSKQIIFASKKGLYFVDKIKQIVNRIDPSIVFRLCFNNYSHKILDQMAKQTPRDIANDQNLVNYEQSEMIYYQLRSLCFLPVDYIMITLDLIQYLAESQNHEESIKAIKTFREEFTSEPEHLIIWNYYGVDLPFMNSYDEDWQIVYRDQWRMKQIQSSKTLVDLIANCIRNENKKVDYLLYRLQKNQAEGRSNRMSHNFSLSKKPQMITKEATQQHKTITNME
eukprot:403372145